MVRRRAWCAWAFAALPACASATQGVARTDAQSSADDATREAPDVSTVDDGTAVDVAVDAVYTDVTDATSPTLDAPPEGPIDGVWRVVDIACNGEAASASARIYITAPNSSSFVVRGDRSTYTLVTSTCTQRLESAVTYPTPGRAVFTAMGPFACAPARCGAGCDVTPAIPYAYDYALRDGGLVMTTVGPTPDITCTAYGQANPIRYTYAPSR